MKDKSEKLFRERDEFDVVKGPNDFSVFTKETEGVVTALR